MFNIYVIKIIILDARCRKRIEIKCLGQRLIDTLERSLVSHRQFLGREDIRKVRKCMTTRYYDAQMFTFSKGISFWIAELFFRDSFTCITLVGGCQELEENEKLMTLIMKWD